MTITDRETRRVLAALDAWYAPAPAPAMEDGDLEGMLAALAEPTTEAALSRWAYKRPPTEPLPAADLAAMERARAAAAAVKS